ncbi:MAG: methyltransferase domain-containing protein [Rhodospirillaceae bacterium]|nr:MAG: methyltransferase domain-containing protein [Rhodospirillaceae bacterium]
MSAQRVPVKPPRQVKYSSDVGTIKLMYAEKTGALTYVQNGGNQTAMDGGGVSLDTYVHAIYSLARQTTAKDVLMIGCGGGVLGTMLVRVGMKVTIVDIDKTSFTLARRHFHMPRDITCHVGDGLAHMQRTRKRYDVLVIDAFIGEKIPKHLTGDAFCQAARRCVRPGGAMFVNVCLDDRADMTALKLAGRLKDNRWTVRLLDRPRLPARNAIIMAGDVGHLIEPRMTEIPETEARRIRSELGALRFRPVDGPEG